MGGSGAIIFYLIRERCAISGLLFSWDPVSPVSVHINASGLKAGCFIYQRYNSETGPLLCAFSTFTAAE